MTSRAEVAVQQRGRQEQHGLAAIIDQMPAGVVVAEIPTGRILGANARWRDYFGVATDEIGTVDDFGALGAERTDGTRLAAADYPLARVVRGGERAVQDELVVRRGGTRRILEVSAVRAAGAEGEEVALVTYFDVTEQRRTSLLVDQNRAVVELIAEGAPLELALEHVVRMIEEHSDGDVLASVLLLDEDGVHLRHAAAPSLPAAYSEAIDGMEIGPNAGSCGTAAHRAAAVIATDIDVDPLWVDFRDVALEHGLRACWSTPILSGSGDVLGTFALYYRDSRGPTPEEHALVSLATRTASVAIERKRLEGERERLLDAERVAREEAEASLRMVEALHRVGQAINASLDLQDVVQVVTDAATELTKAEFGAFFYNVIRADGEAYTLYTLSGAPRSAFESFPMPRNTDIFDPTFKGTAIMRLDDVLADPRYGNNEPYSGMPAGHLPVRSYLAVPVKNIEGDVLGGLFFGHKDPGVFSEEAERLAVGVAAQAAVAIERAQLYVREHQARAEAEQRAHAALSLEHVNDGVCLVDGEGVIRIWNPAAASITGLRASAVVGVPFREALPALAAVAEEVTQRAGSDAVLPSRTVQADFGDDRRLWLAVSGSRFGDGVVYTFRDRSEELRVEQLRSDLIATVSHELRTPLAAVYGATQTIARREVAEQPELREQLLAMIATETERLGRVVNDILLASELQTLAEPRSQTAPVDAVAVARRVVDLARHRAGDVDLVVEVESDDLPHVSSDADRLQQVLGNLVDNGLKYGAGGGTVTVRLASAGDRVRISVIDSGPGIPVQEAQRIFDRFYRLDPAQRSGVAGTGLGLYIARRFITGMGGEIWLETTPGGGATFVVELRTAACAPA